MSIVNVMVIVVKCEIVDVVGFKSLFNSINDIFNEITFTCDSEGIRFDGLGGGYVIFMFVNLDEDYFIEYECPEPDMFTLNVNELKKVLKSCKDQLTIENVDNKVILTSKNKVFTLYEYDTDYAGNNNPPDILYDYKVEVPISFLKETIKDIKLFSEDVIIRTSEYDFIMECEGTTGEYSNKYVCAKSLEATKSKYNRSWVEIMLGADKVNDTMTIKGKNDAPLTIEVENIGVNVKYMLAPKIGVE